jgi:hypothetical protein
MTNFTIPWNFLNISPEPENPIIAPPKTQKSFAQALTNLCDIPLSQIQQPVIKGDRLAIEIPEAAYEAGLEACKHNLHGRIIWPKGSTPLSVVALKAKLALIWKDLARWGIISLGKGYYEFTFSSLEDVRRVRSVPSWNLKPGLLKFFAWSKDFNPKLQHNTSAQVWVKIFGLSQEYWHKTILFTIAGSLGTPICIDSFTAKPMHERTFGQFARVLVDIDLLQPLRYKLLVERKGFAFFVDLEYEHIPAFCTECKMIGHDFENCKRSNLDAAARYNKEPHLKPKAPEKKQAYVQITDGRLHQGASKEIVAVNRENVEEEQSQVPPNNNDNNNARVDCIHATEMQNQVSPVNVDGSIPELLAGSMQHDTSTKRAEEEHILSPVSPKTLARMQDQQLEHELNDASDGSWSTDGSFVNTTQLVGQVVGEHDMTGKNTNEVVTPNNPIGGENSITVPSNLVPERVARDMHFLKQSWANMTEAAEEELQQVDDTSLPTNSNEQGFQLHLTKQQKKAQKKITQSSRDSYATRSKVPPKPFR